MNCLSSVHTAVWESAIKALQQHISLAHLIWPELNRNLVEILSDTRKRYSHQVILVALQMVQHVYEGKVVDLSELRFVLKRELNNFSDSPNQ